MTQTKDKGEKYYIGVNSGMCHIVRPAMYGSLHHVVNLSKYVEKTPKTRIWGQGGDGFRLADVVGYCCESGDVMAHDHLMDIGTDEDDVIMFGTTGAYGRCMSSEYNMRKAPKETVLVLE